MANTVNLLHKSLIWPQSLLSQTTGSPKPLENFKKNILIFIKCNQKVLNVFGSALKVEKIFLLLLGRQPEVALSSGSNLRFYFFMEIEL